MQRTLCSLFYQELVATRPYRPRDAEGQTGFSTTFRVAPAPRDGYNLLVIPDMEEIIQYSSSVPRSILTQDTTAILVAKDLITTWRDNVSNPQVGSPGVFICEDNDVRDANGKIITPATGPSDRELVFWRGVQTRYCESVCVEASDLKTAGKFGLIKPQKHHEAAQWLGKTFDWMTAQEQEFTRDCPVCGSAVKAGKFKCAACGEMFDPVGYEKWKKELLETQLTREKLKNDALKANPNIKPEDLELVGAAMAPAEKKR